MDNAQAKMAVKSRDMQALARWRRELWEHPRLVYLFVELTDRCNLRCRHCGSRCEPSHGRCLPTDLLLRTLDEVAEDFEPRTVMVCLTGGEPLLHPDFDAIVRHIVSRGFPWGMTTNGTLIDEKRAALLREEGLASVTVSLDGLRESHDALRQCSGSFDRTVKGMAFLKAAGIPVQVTTVLHKGNFAEREALFAFLCACGIASWRVVNMEPIGRALDAPELLLDRQELLQLLDFIREKRFSRHTPMDVRYGCAHYLSYEYEHEVRDNYFLCGAGLYVAGIRSNGDITACLDIPPLPELVQGNIARDRLSRVWWEGFAPFRADRSEHCAECRACAERAFCGGDAAHTWDFAARRPLFCLMRKEHPYEL